MNPNLLTIAQAAEELGLSVGTVRALVRSHALEAIEGLQRNKRIRRASLEQLIHGQWQQQAASGPRLRNIGGGKA